MPIGAQLGKHGAISISADNAACNIQRGVFLVRSNRLGTERGYANILSTDINCDIGTLGLGIGNHLHGRELADTGSGIRVLGQFRKVKGTRSDIADGTRVRNILVEILLELFESIFLNILDVTFRCMNSVNFS